MKKNVGLILLIIYLNAAAQPLLPWISDCIEHTFNWKEHVEKVHHGHEHSHHVGYEMNMHEDDTSDTVPDHTFFFHKDALSAHLNPAFAVMILTRRQLQTLLPPDTHLFYRSITGDVLIPPPNV